MHFALFLFKIIDMNTGNSKMINVKQIDPKSMLVAFEVSSRMYLICPPYDLNQAREIDKKDMSNKTIMNFKSDIQFVQEMQRLQKMFAVYLSQGVITKYAAGMSKNFTPSETRALLLRRLEDVVNSSKFPDIVLHELHALQMSSGFNQKERTKISLIMRDAEDSVKKRVENRLESSVLDYEDNFHEYINSIVHYSKLFTDPEKAKESLEIARTAIAHLMKNHQDKMPDGLKKQLVDIYSHLNEEYKSALMANGEYQVKPWQWKYHLDEPGLKPTKK